MPLVIAAQGVCSGLVDIPDVEGGRNGSSPGGALLALLARLLFLEHSRPLHRLLLAFIRRLPPRLLAHFAHAFEQQARAWQQLVANYLLVASQCM